MTVPAGSNARANCDIKPRWKSLISLPNEGIDRRFYKICVPMQNLKTHCALRPLGQGFTPILTLMSTYLPPEKFERSKSLKHFRLQSVLDCDVNIWMTDSNCWSSNWLRSTAWHWLTSYQMQSSTRDAGLVRHWRPS
jgi:hypothetical protein